MLSGPNGVRLRDKVHCSYPEEDHCEDDAKPSDMDWVHTHQMLNAEASFIDE
jgi:hypothetical protein